MRRWLTAASVLVLFSSPAWAHPGHGPQSFASGLAHPLSGLDHVLAMVAVGMWAAQIGGRARWVLPAAFVGVMALGGVLGIEGISLPLVEAGIAASIVVLGLLIVTASRWPVWAAFPLVAGFALFHGHAHGAELPPSVSASGYAAGFALATALLHAAGLGVGVLAMRTARPVALRVAGAAVAVAGVVIAWS